MPWETSDRRAALPSNWAAIRAKVLKRDGYQCTWRLPKTGKRCPRPATDVDHKNGRNDHALDSLQALCEHHHEKKTVREAWQAKRAKKANLRRPPERHPGER